MSTRSILICIGTTLVATFSLADSPTVAQTANQGNSSLESKVVEQQKQIDELKSMLQGQNQLLNQLIQQNQNGQLQGGQSQNQSTFQYSSSQSNLQPEAVMGSGNSGILLEDKPKAPKPINDGYKGGFTLMGPISDLKDGKPKFTMNIGSWGQLRHNFFDSDGPTLDQNDLEFERLRLTFNGYAYNPNFTYSFQFDADSDSGAGAQNVDMLDYYGTYDFGNDWFGAPKKALRLRFGRWKVGFNRAREESGTKMQFSDRSTASVLFDFDRSIAVGLLGEMTPWMGENLAWELTLTNGIDNAGFRPSRAGQLDRNLGVSTRINWLLTGDWGKDGHADLEFRDAPAIRLGSGFTYTRPDREGANEFNFPRVVDTGANINTVLPAGVSAYNLFMFANDINIKYQGFSLICETYYRQIAGFSGGGLPKFSDYGVWFETGYFIVPQRVQLISRYAYIEGNSATLGTLNRSFDELGSGVVFYFNKHNSKLTFDVSSFNGSPAQDSALNVRAGDDGILYRTTYQWKF